MEPIFNRSMRTEIDSTSNSFIDRENELQLCVNSMLTGEKAILIGERGVGKTALVRSVQRHLIENYESVLPIYISFSPVCFDQNTKTGYVYHLLISLIHYIWTNTLGYKLTDLYDDNLPFQNELTTQVQKMHRLARITNHNYIVQQQKELEAQFFIKGNAQQSHEHEYNFNPLSVQELIGLFCECCNDLIDYTAVKTIAFLCDEANLLNDRQQLEIERELSNIFPMLSCSFLYVASTSTTTEYRNPHTEFFDEVIHLKGFYSVEHSKRLLQNRILQKDLIEVEENVYGLLLE